MLIEDLIKVPSAAIVNSILPKQDINGLEEFELVTFLIIK